MKSKNIKNLKSVKLLKDIEKISLDKFNKMSKILDKNKNYTITFNKDSNEIILMENNNKILIGNYNFYGIIKPDGRFMWAYMIPGVDKRILNSIKKIKSFAYLFENSDDKKMMLYHQILTQDSIMLNEDEIVDLRNLILYLSEDLYFFNSVNSAQNIQLIYLSKINEKYV